MALPAEKRYTYADMLNWPEDERVELIYGEPYLMAPSPIFAHQSISVAIESQLYQYLKGKKCRVLHAPFDVFLFGKEDVREEDVDTVVQPDIFVVCDPSKWREKYCNGAPDLIIEILSKSTTKHDRVTKFNLYQRAGVKEYWIVDPRAEVVLVHTLENGQYHSPAVYTSNSAVPIGVLEDCSIDFADVFSEADWGADE